MSRVILEYVFEGHRRGYNFTTTTDGFDEETLKTIWRSAMARGQGWGNEIYTGARSIKCFPLPDDRIAISEVTVTDLEDESGRRGIRRAVVDAMTPAVFRHHLRSRMLGYPLEVQKMADHHYQFSKRQLPRLKKDHPLVIVHPYKTLKDWWIMEALVLKLVTEPFGPLQKWEMPIPFTTLALDYRNESKIVVIPSALVGKIDVPVLAVR